MNDSKLNPVLKSMAAEKSILIFLFCQAFKSLVFHPVHIISIDHKIVNIRRFKPAYQAALRAYFHIVFPHAFY